MPANRIPCMRVWIVNASLTSNPKIFVGWKEQEYDRFSGRSNFRLAEDPAGMNKGPKV